MGRKGWQWCGGLLEVGSACAGECTGVCVPASCGGSAATYTTTIAAAEQGCLQVAGKVLKAHTLMSSVLVQGYECATGGGAQDVLAVDLRACRCVWVFVLSNGCVRRAGPAMSMTQEEVQNVYWVDLHRCTCRCTVHLLAHADSGMHIHSCQELVLKQQIQRILK